MPSRDRSGCLRANEFSPQSVSSKVTAGASQRFPELYKLVARLLEIATPLPGTSGSQKCSTGHSHNLRFDLSLHYLRCLNNNPARIPPPLLVCLLNLYVVWSIGANIVTDPFTFGCKVYP